jgi:nucleoside-diphosphate-sugar epimerase
MTGASDALGPASDMTFEVQRVLVTGATGFIGSHLVRRLISLGFEVHVLVRPTSDLARLPAGVIAHTHHGAVEDLQTIVETARPDVTFHLATHFVGRHLPSDVRALATANVLFPAQLFEALSNAGATRLVTASSAWQFAIDGTFRPLALYAAMKQASDDILQYYTEVDRLRAIRLVLHDTYGPGDTRAKLIPLMQRAASDGTVLRMTPGAQLLDLVHVNDVVDAILLAARRLVTEPWDAMETFVVSSRNPMMVRTLVEMFRSVLQATTGKVLQVELGARPYREREVMEPWAGGQLLPGWTAKIGLADGLAEMVSTP